MWFASAAFRGYLHQHLANAPVPTPQYDYDQVLYRLDLDDPALVGE